MRLQLQVSTDVSTSSCGQLCPTGDGCYFPRKASFHQREVAFGRWRSVVMFIMELALEPRPGYNTSAPAGMNMYSCGEVHGVLAPSLHDL